MRVQVEFVHFSLAGSAKDAVAVQIGGLENAPCGVATVLGECVLVEGLLSQVEGYQSASLGTDIECSVIFDGRPQDTDVVIQDCAGIVKVEQVCTVRCPSLEMNASPSAMLMEPMMNCPEWLLLIW